MRSAPRVRAAPIPIYTAFFFACLTTHLGFGASAAPSGNPFRIPREAPPWRITNAQLSSADGGLYHAPNRVSLSFRLLDREGHFISALPESALDLAVRIGGKTHPVPVRTVSRDGRLHAILDLPSVGGPGLADLSISLREGGRPVHQVTLPASLRFGAMALDLVFLIDNSGSMADNDPSGSRFKAALACLEAAQMKWAIRRVALVVFSDRPEVALPFTDTAVLRDSPRLREILAAQKPGGRTEIPAALRKTAELIGENRGSVKTAVVLLTDGASTTPLSDEDKRFRGLGIPIYPVGLHSGGSKEYDPALLTRLAQQTGGTFSDGRAPELSGLYLRALGHFMAVRDRLAIAAPPSRVWADEAPVVSWSEISEIPGMTFEVATADRPLEILLVKSNGSRRDALLAPLPIGTHSLRARWQRRSELIAARDWALGVQTNPSPLMVRGDFQARISLLRRQALLSFTLHNPSDQDLRVESEFLPLTRSEGGVLDRSRLGPEEPLTLLSARETRGIAFHVELQGLEPGLYSGAFLLCADSRWQAANLSVELLPQGPEPTTYLAPESPPRPWLFFLLAGTCLVTVLWGVLFVVQTTLTRAVSPKKNR